MAIGSPMSLSLLFRDKMIIAARVCLNCHLKDMDNRGGVANFEDFKMA